MDGLSSIIWRSAFTIGLYKRITSTVFDTHLIRLNGKNIGKSIAPISARVNDVRYKGVII